MANSLWLDLRRGSAAGMECPFLQELHGPYKFFDDHPLEVPRFIMLVRGERCLQELPRHGDQVHMSRIGASVLVDCGLHLSRRMPKVKAGPLPGNITMHQVEGAQGLTLPHLARRLYGRFLSPLSTTIVLFEKEYGGLTAVLNEVAGWVHPEPRSVDCRPLVLIFATASTYNSISPRNVERDLTTEILLHFNPCREHSLRSAEKAWRGCFMGIKLLEAPDERSPLVQLMLDQSLAIQSKRRTFTGSQLAVLLRAACAQFSQDPGSSLSILLAARASPISTQLPRQIEKLLGHTEKDRELGHSAYHLIASRLALDAYRRGQFYEQFYGTHGLKFPPDEVFAGIYSELLKGIQRRRKTPHLVAIVGSIFKELANNITPGCNPPLSHREALGQLRILYERIRDESLCLSCLAHVPSNTLSCGHLLCDACVRRSQALHDWSFQWPRCTLCQRANDFPITLKPTNAGVRVLRLSGSLQDARAIGSVLKSLRSVLSGSLDQHFDLVIGSGIGIFFIVMIFCKQATVEDCIYHIPNLEFVEVSKREISFNSGLLRFRRDELQARGVKMVLPNKQHLYPSPGKSWTAARAWRRKLSFGGGDSISTDTIPQPDAEASHLWGGTKIDIVFDYLGGTCNASPEIPTAANILLASLFYVEAEASPKFYSASPVVLVLIIKCRLPAGRHLTDLMMKARMKKIKVYYGGDGPVKTSYLCTAEAWNGVREGKHFVRRVNVRLLSPDSLVHFKLDGITEVGRVDISNSPCQVRKLIKHVSPQNDMEPQRPASERIELLQKHLHQFAI